MTCKHIKSRVLETHRHDSGDVYRRRLCGACHCTFVTCETAPAGLKMPAQFNGKARAKLKAVKPAEGEIVLGWKRL